MVERQSPLPAIEMGRYAVDLIQETPPMKIKRIVFVLSLSLLGTFAALTPANLHAQTNADIARNAFEVTVPVNVNNFTYTPVTIPAGKRLVVQNVSLSGAAQTDGAYVVPIVILSSSINSGASNLHYFAPSPYPTDTSQFYLSTQTTIYADQLEVSPAFAGFTPTFLAFNVVITGYLVDLPK